jgi:hypothetical protein
LLVTVVKPSWSLYRRRARGRERVRPNERAVAKDTTTAGIGGLPSESGPSLAVLERRPNERWPNERWPRRTEQIERRMAELEATAPEIDEIVAERFGDLRSAIAEHLRTGRNIDEVRFLLRRYFESFVVRDDEGGRAIVANLRPDVVDDVMADLAGAKREALRGLTTAHNGLPSAWVVARIAGRVP